MKMVFCSRFAPRRRRVGFSCLNGLVIQGLSTPVPVLPEVWQQYKWHAVGAIALFVFLQVLLIGALVYAQARRKRAGEARASAGIEELRLQRALQASEARNHAMLKGIPATVFVLDSEGKILDYSASDQNELYAPPEQVLGRNIRERLPKDAAEAIVSTAGQAMKSAEPASLEFSLPMGNGTHFFDARIIPLEINKVLTVVHNVTSVKRAEMELETTKRFFAQITRMMPGALFVYDLVERRNVYVNQGGWGLLGYSDREVLEMGDAFLERTMHPDDLSTLPKLTERYATTVDGEVLENVVSYAAQERRVALGASPCGNFCQNADGRPRQLIGTAADITALKTAEEDLRQLSSRLLHAQDAERRRIARQLHDGTAQNIFAVRLNLARVAQKGDFAPSALKTLSECQSLCDTSLQEIRTLSYLMHPPCSTTEVSYRPCAGSSTDLPHGAASLSSWSFQSRRNGCLSLWNGIFT